MLTTAVANAELTCAAVELSRFIPPDGMTCASYMATYISIFGGKLYGDPQSSSECEFCTATSTNTYLQALSLNFNDAWRNFGLMIVYIAFNCAAALFIYWLARVPKKTKID